MYKYQICPIHILLCQRVVHAAAAYWLTIVIENAVQLTLLVAVLIVKVSHTVSIQFLRTFLGGLFAPQVGCTFAVKAAINQNCCLCHLCYTSFGKK